ncbi:MAG: SDR family NAD(P)-dependent oxidoreductase [Tumebacillaceae bacterium]
MTIKEISFRLDNKVALITGAGRGIGKAVATGLAQAGADVVLVARTQSQLDEAAAEIAELTGRRTLALACDLADPQAIEDTVAQAIAHFGRIDILVNNAGIGDPKPIMMISAEEWDQVMDINLRSVLLMSQAVGRHMIEQKWGRIVNVASVSSGMSFGILNAYGPSKAGVANLTINLAHDLIRHGITVNAISPWFFKTSMTEAALETDAFRDFSTSRTPIGRIGDVEELIAPVLFFCSEGASYVNGQNLFVDGGAINFGM